MNLHTIFYISTTRTPLTGSELTQLLAKSRRRNGDSDVTGLLVAGGRRFMQVLEGPEPAVRATYQRISQDPRHFAIVTLADKPIAARNFAGWAMGFETGGDAGPDLSLHDQLAAIISSISDRNLRAYFEGFVKSHGSTSGEAA